MPARELKSQIRVKTCEVLVEHFLNKTNKRIHSIKNKKMKEGTKLSSRIRIINLNDYHIDNF